MEKNSILVIDDDRNILAIIEMYLRKAGYEVTCGERGDEALQLFRKVQPALVVLDVMLPGLLQHCYLFLNLRTKTIRKN